jgi:hypothetical protein
MSSLSKSVFIFRNKITALSRRCSEKLYTITKGQKRNGILFYFFLVCRGYLLECIQSYNHGKLTRLTVLRVYINAFVDPIRFIIRKKARTLQ